MKNHIENKIIEYFVEGKIRQVVKDFLLEVLNVVPENDLKKFEGNLPLFIFASQNDTALELIEEIMKRRGGE